MRRLFLWPGQRGRKITIVGVYVGFCMALSYRPGHPWAGLAGGAVSVVVLALVLMLARTLLQLADAKRRDRR